MKNLALLLMAILISSCIGTNTPRLPQDVKDLVTPNCIRPPEGYGIAVIEWEKMLKKMPEGRIFVGTEFEQEARNEFLEMARPGGETKCWKGPYNWSQGKVMAERVETTLDPTKTYVIIEIDAVIEIVTYLIENVWKPLKKALPFLQTVEKVFLG